MHMKSVTCMTSNSCPLHFDSHSDPMRSMTCMVSMRRPFCTDSHQTPHELSDLHDFSESRHATTDFMKCLTAD